MLVCVCVWSSSAPPARLVPVGKIAWKNNEEKMEEGQDFAAAASSFALAKISHIPEI